MLSIRNLEVVYSDVILVLRGISFDVPEGGIVALLGANGAGTTTTIRAITGLLDVHEGDVTNGEIKLDGRPIHRWVPASIVKAGIAQTMEGRRIISEFTVEENLRIGAHAAPSALAENLDRVYGLFPILAERRKSTAGFLSGGEQQMLAMGRALMAGPRFLLLVAINSQGTGVLLVEQNAKMALSIASHGYVMETGKLVMDKPSDELLADDDVREFYLGIGGDDSVRSFRDVKHYRRKKHWA